MQIANKYPKLIFFDGVCGLCNNFVDFVLKRDKHNKFYFTPLQSELSQEVLPKKYSQNIDTIVYKKEDKIYVKSTAALHIMSDMGGLFKLSKLAFIFPLFIRDAVYDWIARNRYRWFGKHPTCRIPTEKERQKIIA